MALYFKRAIENGEKKRAIALYNGSTNFITQSANEFKEYSENFAQPLYFDDVDILPYEEALKNYHSLFDRFDLAHKEKIYEAEDFKGDIYKNIKGEAIFTREDDIAGSTNFGDNFKSNTLIGAFILGFERYLYLGQMGGELKEVYSFKEIPSKDEHILSRNHIGIKAIYENYSFEITRLSNDKKIAKDFGININFSSYYSLYKYGAWLFSRLKRDFKPFSIVEIFIANEKILYSHANGQHVSIEADGSIDLTAREKAGIYACMLLFDRNILYIVDELISQKKKMGSRIYPYGYQGEEKIKRKIPKVELPDKAQKKQNERTLEEFLKNHESNYWYDKVFGIKKGIHELYYIQNGEIVPHAGLDDAIKEELEKRLSAIKEKIDEKINEERANHPAPHRIERLSDKTLGYYLRYKDKIRVDAYTHYNLKGEPLYTEITPNIGKEDEPDEKPEFMKDEYAICANFANGVLTLRANRNYFISDKIKFGVKYQRSGVVYEFLNAKELKIYHYGSNGNAFNFKFTKTQIHNGWKETHSATFAIKAQGETKFPVLKDEFIFLENDVFKNNKRAYIMHKKIGDKIHFNDDTHKAKIYLMGASLYTRNYGGEI